MRRVGWFVLMSMPSLAWAQPAPKGPVLADPWPDEPPAPPPSPVEPAPAPLPPAPPEAKAPAAPGQSPEPTDAVAPPPAAPRPAAPRPDDQIAPSEVRVDEVPPVPPYPRAFVDRPLVLPRGMHVFSIAGTLGRESVETYRLDSAGGGRDLRGRAGRDRERGQ